MRESTCELTANAIREGMFALMMPVMIVDGRALRRDDQVDPGRARELGDPADRRLDLAGRDHHEVGQLVDQDNDVRQRLVGILGVVLLDLAHAGARNEALG